MRGDARQYACLGPSPFIFNMMNKRILLFGLSSGALMVGLFMLSFAFGVGRLGYSAAEQIGFLSILLGLSTIFWAIKAHRDQDLGGRITLGGAMKAGLLVSLLASAVMGLFSAVLFEFTDMAANMESMLMVDYQAEGLTQQEAVAKIAEQMAAAPESMQNPWIQGLIMFLTVLPLGAIISLISALILKRNSPQAS